MIPEDVCKAYIDANLRFPQIEIGIVPMVANAMFRAGQTHCEPVLTAPFSPEQVMAVRVSMNRVHRAWKIPALSPDFVDDRAAAGEPPSPGITLVSDERLLLVWHHIQHYVVDALVDCISWLRPATALPPAMTSVQYRVLARAVDALFCADEALWDTLQRLFAALVDALDHADGRALAREFRDAVDYSDPRRAAQLLIRARLVIQDSLAPVMSNAVRALSPEIATMIEEQRWRVFRTAAGAPA